jgi:hypothetical protein
MHVSGPLRSSAHRSKFRKTRPARMQHADRAPYRAEGSKNKISKETPGFRSAQGHRFVCKTTGSFAIAFAEAEEAPPRAARSYNPARLLLIDVFGLSADPEGAHTRT